MSRSLLIAIVVAVAFPGTAAARTIDCVEPFGPNGAEITVTLRVAPHEGCPPPGAAIPTEKVVAMSQPVSHGSGPVIVHSAPVSAPVAANAVPVSLPVPAPATGVVSALQARAVLPGAPTAAVSADPEVPRFELPRLPHTSIGLLLLALIGGTGLLAGPGGRVRWTA